MGTDLGRDPSGARGADAVLGARSRRLTRIALVLGSITIAGALVLGLVAQHRSRGAVIQGLFADHLSRARTRAGLLEFASGTALEQHTLDLISRYFEETPKRFEGGYLCVVGPDGRQLLNTGHPEQVGVDIGHMPFRGTGPAAPETSLDLIREKRDWVGRFESLAGDAQMVAFVYVRDGPALVAYHVPWHSVEREVEKAMFPWQLAFALIVLVALPILLFLMHAAYRSAYGAIQHTQDELRASQARLVSAIESMPFDLWMCDHDGRYILQNPAAIRRWGDQIGKTPDETGVDVDTVAAWKENNRRALAGAEVAVEHTEIHNGRVRHLHTIVAPIRDGAQTLGIVGVNLDLTERRRAEQLQATQQHVLDLIIRRVSLEQVLEALIVGIEEQSSSMIGSILLLDRDGRHLRHGSAPHLPEEYNRAVNGIEIGPVAGSCGTAAYNRERIVVTDLSIDPLWARFRQIALPHGLRACWSQPILSAQSKVLGTFAMYYREPRAPSIWDVQLIEHAARLAGIAIERSATEEVRDRLTLELRALREIDRAILSGQPLDRIVCAALDSIQPLLGASALTACLFQESKGRLFAFPPRATSAPSAGATPAAPPAVGALVGPVFSLQEWGPAILDTLRGGVVRESVDDASLPAPLKSAHATRSSTERRQHMLVPMVANGELVGTLNLSTQRASRLPEDLELARQVANVLAVAVRQARLHEAVELQAAQLEKRVIERTEELRAVNAELEGFVNTVSHDLRAPLRSIQGFGQALREDCASELPAAGHDHLARIVAAAERMDRLIQDLLSYSRLGRTEIRLEPLDTRAIIDEAMSLVGDEIRERGAEVEVEMPLAAVVGHASTLSQVLGNLLVNAAKFAHPGRAARVLVTTEKRAGRVRIFVKDDGIGIAPEHHARIFQAFERLHGEERYPGTGIGLAIVARGVQRMRGTYGVESVPGDGSRFWVELPAAEDRK